MYDRLRLTVHRIIIHMQHQIEMHCAGFRPGGLVGAAWSAHRHPTSDFAHRSRRALYVGRGRGRGEAWLQHGMTGPLYLFASPHGRS